MQNERSSLRIVHHEQLREERRRRGWSRAYIAEQIGVADPKTIGRWERGEAFPSAYFLPRLCELFQMSAEDLGLWQRECRVTDEGMLWISLGSEDDLLDELRRWGRKLGVDEQTLLHQESAEEWARAIHSSIGKQKTLLLIISGITS